MTYTTPAFSSIKVIGVAFAIIFSGSCQPVTAAAPAPDDDGFVFCSMHDEGDGASSPLSNKCCYEEKVNDSGDTLEVCIQCDANWKNCEEVWEDGTSTPPVTPKWQLHQNPLHTLDPSGGARPIPPLQPGTLNRSIPGLAIE